MSSIYLPACHRLITLKSGKEPRPTVFWSGLRLRVERTSFEIDAERAERNSQSLNHEGSNLFPMIRKESRIKREKFEKVMKKGELISSHLFSFRIERKSLDLSHNSAESTSNFSVVVSKKVAKTSVSRNLLRRRVYEILRNIEKRLKNPCKIIVFAKKDSEVATFKALESEITAILENAKIFQ